MIDSTNLACFLRIVDLGSINRAAENLGISQPTLSRIVQTLEQEVKQELLVRTPKGVRVTTAGALLADRARTIVSQLEHLQVDLANSAAHSVSLGVPTSIFRLLGAPIARSLIEQRPGLKLRLYDGLNNDIRLWMEDGLLDVAMLCSLERMPANYESTPFISEQLMLVGAADPAARHHQDVELTELDQVKLILPGRPNKIRVLVENAMHRAGVKYLCSIEAETLWSCLQLARDGLGYSIVPSCALAGFDQEALTVRPVRGLILHWDLCVSSARKSSSIVGLVTAELKRLVAHSMASGLWPSAQIAIG